MRKQFKFFLKTGLIYNFFNKYFDELSAKLDNGEISLSEMFIEIFEIRPNEIFDFIGNSKRVLEFSKEDDYQDSRLKRT